MSLSNFEETYYCKERNDIEMNTLFRCDKEKEKVFAEQEILKNIRILDFT